MTPAIYSGLPTLARSLSTALQQRTPPHVAGQLTLFPASIGFSEFCVLTPSFRLLTTLTRRLRQLDRIFTHESEYLLSSSRYRLFSLHRRRLTQMVEIIRLRLVDNAFICHTLRSIARRYSIFGGKSYAELRAFYRLSEISRAQFRDVFCRSVFAKYEKTRLQVQHSNYNANLRDEVALAHSRGWFMVFDTLTIEESQMDEVFSEGSPILTNYIKRIRRAVCAGSGLSVSQSKGVEDDHYRYFAIVQHGSLRGRLHYHFFHLCKALPLGSADPNHPAMVYPDRREVYSFKKFWPHGRSQPLSVRYSCDDAFSRARWRWPVKRDKVSGDYFPVAAGGIMAVVNYVAGYISKTEESLKWKTKEGNSAIARRCRQTRNFGRTWMLERARAIPLSLLKTVAGELPRRNLLPNPNLPSFRRMRNIVLRELARRGVLNAHFLISTPAPPICRLGRLDVRVVRQMMSLPMMSFGHSIQRQIDMAIFEVRSYFYLSIPGILFGAPRAPFSR